METLLKVSKDHANIKVKGGLAGVVPDWAFFDDKDLCHVGIGHPNSDRTFLRTILPLPVIKMLIQFPSACRSLGSVYRCGILVLNHRTGTLPRHISVEHRGRLADIHPSILLSS